MGLPTFIAGAGPGHATDATAYFFSGSETGFSLVTDTGVNYLEADNTATGMVATEVNSVTVKRFSWLVIENVRLTGTMSSNQNVRFSTVRNSTGNTIGFEMSQSSDTSHFVIRITQTASRTLIVDGTELVTVGDYFNLRVQLEDDIGSTTAPGLVTTWVNGNLDAHGVATTTGGANIGKTAIDLRTDDIGASQTIRWSNIVLCHSDSAGDRPGTTVHGGEAAPHYPTGNMVGEYGDQVDCNTTDGKFENWDDWASGNANDATDFNCEEATASGKEISDTGNQTVTNIIGVVLRGRAKANIASKTVTTSMIIRDASGDEQSVFNTNLGSDSFAQRYASFPLAPDGGAWTQTDLDEMGIGILSANNGATDDWTALFAESFGISEDPASGSGAALGSANAGTY